MSITLTSSMSSSSSSSSSGAPIITVTPVREFGELHQSPTKPPRAAAAAAAAAHHHPRSIFFRDVVTRDEAAWLARRVLGERARLVEYHVRPYSEEKIGFLGTHLRLAILAKDDDAAVTEQRLSFFVKTVPRDLPGQAAYIEEKGCFRKESDFFRSFVALVDRGDDNEEATTRSWCPTCYLAKPDVLVFEDLRLRGFANQPRMFAEGAMRSAVACLARFHASSLRLEARLGRPLSQLFPRLLEETEFKRSGRSLEWHAAAVELAVRLARDRLGLDDDGVQLLRRAGQTVFDMCLPSKSALNVVSHGDLWSSNLMFDAELDCRLVDYQLLRYAPLAHDLAQLLYLCSTRQFRRSHEADMIELYCKTLQDCLTRTNKYEGPMPSSEEIRRGYEEQRLPACATAMIFHPTVLMDGRIAATVMDDPVTYEQYYFTERLPIVERIMAGDKEYEARIMEDVEELVEMSRGIDDVPKPT